MPIGFLDDAWAFVSDTVEDVWDETGARAVDAADSAIRALPGGSALIEAAGDAARSPAGMVVLRAMTTMLYGSAAWAIGPQLAAVTFAIPGLMRGERFDEAWLGEFKWRVEKTAETLGPGVIDAFGAQLSTTLRKMLADFGAGDVIEASVQDLAARYGVREDVAAFALALWNRVELPPRDAFDASTGRQTRQWQASAAAKTEATEEDQRAWRALYGAREHELLYGDRERALVTTRSSAPVAKTSSTGSIALALVAAAALVAWRRGML